MSEIDRDYRPKIEHSHRWFFVGRSAAQVAIWDTMKLEIDDRRHSPVAHPLPTVVAPTHRSNIDPFTTGVAAHRLGYGRIAYLAKEEIPHPLGSKLAPDASLARRALAQTVDFIPSQVIQRIAGHPTTRGGNADLEDINNWGVHELEDMGVSVVLFPEGKRKKAQLETNGPLADGAAFIAIHADSSITPVGNAGTADIKFQRRRDNIVVNRFEDPLVASDYIAPNDRNDPDTVKRAAKDMTADLADILQESYAEAADMVDYLASGRNF